MPHISVKLYPGRSEEQKQAIAAALAEAMMASSGCSDSSLSISIEEVEPTRWKDKVYAPEIESAGDRLYKQPGYKPA